MLATDKQVAFISKLLDERNLGSSTDEGVRLKAPDLDVKAASAWISRLLDLPKLESLKPEPAVDVPAGRYAIQPLGEWSLLRVWRGTRGPNPPTFVYEVQGTEKGTRLPRADEKVALAAIAKDPGQAAIDFGHRTGSCSRCGIELERNLSRKLGIGPSCLRHFYEGDAKANLLAQARAELREAGIDPAAKHDDLVVA